MNTTAYSYARYSSPEQGRGDSERRQAELSAAYCKRHGLTLDKSRRMTDRGLSGYRGEHLERGALGAFLEDVRAGRITPGSTLICENLDRLSRLNPWQAVSLLAELVGAGIRVAVLQPSEMLYTQGSDLTSLMVAVMEFGRGHSESKSKANRSAGNWQEKRKRARESGAVLTRKLPGWIAVGPDGKFALIPERARTVRRIFELAGAGLGAKLIARRLTQDGVASWGYSGKWGHAHVHNVLTSRATFGAFQPRTGGRADGPELADYFPAAITERTFNVIQGVVGARHDRQKGPRAGRGTANLFSGLLFDTATRSALCVVSQTQGDRGRRRKRRVLVSADSLEGRAPAVSFPADIFEEAILGGLREVRGEDVLAGPDASESAGLAATLAGLEARIAGIEAELAGEGDVPSLARVLRGLEGQRQEAARRLAEARVREANPAREAWAEATGLMAAAKGEAGRLRLRALIRATVQSVWVLVTRSGIDRLALAQVHFHGGGRRDYAITYRPANRSRPGTWGTRSWRWPGNPKHYDMRLPCDAAIYVMCLQVPGMFEHFAGPGAARRS